MSNTDGTLQSPPRNAICWPTTLFLIGMPLVSLTLVPWYFLTYGVQWSLIVMALTYGIATGFTITAGYHRLYSHLSYDAKSWIKFIYLMVGAASWQSSAMKWCTDHRRHHRYVDTNDDPYNINRGFFFAHFGWMLTKDDPKYRGKFEEDLKEDKWVRIQHDYYIPIAIFMGFGVPMLMGWAVGSPLGGLLVIGFLRIAVTQHNTFFINSLCHMFGTRPYSDKVTARDNMVLALLTYGEGYHNYHHRFASDYRNGIRWYHWDPTKWIIWSTSFVGWTFNLKSIPSVEILTARMQMDVKKLAVGGATTETAVYLTKKVEEAQRKFRKMREEYRQLKVSVSRQSRSQLSQLRYELKVAKIEAKTAFAHWIAYRRFALRRIPAPVYVSNIHPS